MPGFFGTVQRLIPGSDAAYYGIHFIELLYSNADAGSHRKRPIFRFIEAAKRLIKRFCECLRFHAFRYKHHKLVPADAGTYGVFQQRLTDRLPHLLNGKVTCGVTVSVIDPLQMIHISIPSPLAGRD